jgi:hypothetical protein
MSQKLSANDVPKDKSRVFDAFKTLFMSSMSRLYKYQTG